MPETPDLRTNPKALDNLWFDDHFIDKDGNRCVVTQVSSDGLIRSVSHKLDPEE